MVFRFSATLILIVSVLFFPWWLNLILFLVFILSFPNFYEAMISALLFDILRQRPDTVWSATLVTVGVFLLIYLSESVKRRIVFYH